MPEWGRGHLVRGQCAVTTSALEGQRLCQPKWQQRTSKRWGKKPQGHRKRWQIQIKISWKGLLLFCQNFKMHLSRTSEYIWQKWLKVPGRCGFEYLFWYLLAVLPWARNLTILETCFSHLPNEHGHTYLITLLGGPIHRNCVVPCRHAEILNEL